jgi:hypothetical protein
MWLLIAIKGNPNLSKNCIGIFYLINGRIVSEKAAVSTIKPSSAVRAYPRQHYDFWSELQKKDPDLYDLDCYALPRGRVLYNEKTRKVEVLADRHILEKDRLRTLVIQDFHLEKSDVQFKEDENYRCAVCENGLEQR